MDVGVVVGKLEGRFDGDFVGRRVGPMDGCRVVGIHVGGKDGEVGI